MVKYSEESKLTVVRDYLTGTLGFTLITRKYGISDKSIVRRWVRAYKVYGRKGLSIKKKKATYSVPFKVDVLHFMKQTGASYQETAIQFGLNNPSLIAVWNRIFLQEGIEGLREKAKGCPSMSKKTKLTPVKNQQEMSREEQLERENELLRLEVAYLKKLKDSD